MIKHKLTLDGANQLWRCVHQKRLRCRARGVSEHNSDEVAMTKPHTHLPNPESPQKRQVTSALKELAAQQLAVPSGQLVTQQLEGLDEGVINALPRRSVLQRNVLNARKHAEGNTVDRRPADVEWTDFFRRTTDGQQPNDPVIFAFASDRGIEQLRRGTRYCMDGTFWASPQGFSQVYVIGVFKQHSFVPCVYFLLPNKEQATYARAFNGFFGLDYVADGVNPTNIMMDMGLGPRYAMLDLFPGAVISHCVFHMAQNFIKGVRRNDLTQLYATPEVRRLLRCLLALCVLREEDVLNGYHDVVDALNLLVNDGVIPQADVPRFIGWNREFNESFSRNGMKLSKFLIRLQQQEEKTRQLLVRHRVNPADPFRNRRRPKIVIRDAQIKALVEAYSAQPANANLLELLTTVQYHLGR